MIQKRLRRARAMKGLSLNQFARAVDNISRRTLSRFERGSVVPNSAQVLQLSEALGVHPEYFFRGESVTFAWLRYHDADPYEGDFGSVSRKSDVPSPHDDPPAPSGIAEPDPFWPDWVSTLSETILDLMEERHWSRRDFADAMERSMEEVDLLLDGKGPISTEDAIRLHAVFRAPVDFWMARDKSARARLPSARALADGLTLIGRD
nr:helix-turn-helix domain-containing protein [uncultured Roseateles sp.]